MRLFIFVVIEAASVSDSSGFAVVDLQSNGLRFAGFELDIVCLLILANLTVREEQLQALCLLASI